MPDQTKSLPLRDALPFLRAHGLKRQAEEIERSAPFRTYKVQMKKAKAVALMRRRKIFEEFCSKHWPFGLTPAAQPLLAHY